MGIIILTFVKYEICSKLNINSRCQMAHKRLDFIIEAVNVNVSESKQSLHWLAESCKYISSKIC